MTREMTRGEGGQGLPGFPGDQLWEMSKAEMAIGPLADPSGPHLSSLGLLSWTSRCRR